MRGATVVSGYFKNEEASAKQIDSEGWFGTGDVAKITPDSWLLIVDRTKDLVKSGGEWISSVELENAIMDDPDVAEAAVIGVADPTWGERPVAYVVAHPGATSVSGSSSPAFVSSASGFWCGVIFARATPQLLLARRPARRP